MCDRCDSKNDKTLLCVRICVRMRENGEEIVCFFAFYN